MWGMIARITILQGKREEMISILTESAARLPGCLHYIVAKDLSEEDVLWVNEVWDSQKSHDASLALPQVQSAIPRAKPLIRGHYWLFGQATPCRRERTGARPL